MESGVVVRGKTHGIKLHVWTLKQRPELAPQVDKMEQTWPEFMRHDMFSKLYYGVAATSFPEYVFVGAEPSNPDVVVAMGFAVPLYLPYPLEDDDLPDGGWDQIVREAAYCMMMGIEPNVVCALEVTIHKDFQGMGLSQPILVAIHDSIAAMTNDDGKQRFNEMIVAVRPSRRGVTGDLVPMDQYAYMVRDDDKLPVDPWLRVHCRVGGQIAKVARRSMVITGTLAEWRRWTGESFDKSGPVLIKGGLVPVQVDFENDYAVYVEPNVWVRHSLGDDWGDKHAVSSSEVRGRVSESSYDGHGSLLDSICR